MSVTIRKATAADASAIAQVHVASWEETYRGILPDEVLDRVTLAGREATWRKILEQEPAVTTLVAVMDDGDVVGFCAGGKRRGDLLPCDDEIQSLYVLARAQRQGIGGRLLVALQDILDRDRERAVGLWVLEENRKARAFYEKMGGVAGPRMRDTRGDSVIAEVAYIWERGVGLRG